MRASIPFLFLIALAGVQAGKPRTECCTLSVSGTKTRTTVLPDRTVVAVKTVRKAGSTTTVTVTPKASTATSVTLALATDTVTAEQVSKTATITTTDFSVEVPSTTVTVATVTPTVTAYATTSGPAKTVTSTTYTLVAPTQGAYQPPQNNPPRRRLQQDDEEEHDFERRTSDHDEHVLRRQPHNKQNKKRGRRVECSKVLTKTITKTKTSTRTATEKVRAERPTVSVTSTLVGTVTNTIYPTPAEFTSTVAVSSTLTAAPVTISATETAPATTTTTVFDFTPQVDVKEDTFDVCKPENFVQKAKLVSAAGRVQNGFTEADVKDAAECCYKVAAKGGSMAFSYCPEGSLDCTPKQCLGFLLADGMYTDTTTNQPASTTQSEQCAKDSPDGYVIAEEGSTVTAGLLQCGKQFR